MEFALRAQLAHIAQVYLLHQLSALLPHSIQVLYRQFAFHAPQVNHVLLQQRPQLIVDLVTTPYWVRVSAQFALLEVAVQATLFFQ